MITNLGDNVSIDFEPDEFQLSGWSKHKTVSSSVNGMDAQTATNGGPPSFVVAASGADIVVTSVKGRVALTRADCWVVKGRETSQLLEHEQGHYYITYITYVVMLQAIRALKVPIASANIPRTASQAQRNTLMHNAITLRARTLVNNAQSRMSALTRDYDAPKPPGTNHSMNRPEQAVWNQRFATSLLQGSAL